jgi:hypothetical protein
MEVVTVLAVNAEIIYSRIPLHKTELKRVNIYAKQKKKYTLVKTLKISAITEIRL